MLKDTSLVICNKIIELLKKHPEFENLKSSIFKDSYINVLGIPEGIEEILLKALERELNFSFIYCLDFTIKEEDIKFFYAKKTDDKINLVNLEKIILDLEYKKVDKVVEDGEYSQKGGIIDVFAGDYIQRFDFFGDNLENVYLIDPLTGGVEYNINFIFLHKSHVNLSISSHDQELFIKSVIIFNSNSDNKILFDLDNIPFIFSNNKILEFELKKRIGGTIVIASKNSNYIELIEAFKLPIKVEYYDEKFVSGFSSNTLNTTLITDKEINGRLDLNLHRKKKNENLLLIGEINLEDLVVHEDHGVGIYRGIVKKHVLGVTRDYLILEYAREDKLYIPLDQISKLTKYIGAKGEKPPLTRLGTMEWERAKEKVKGSIKEMASELLKLYALREVITKEPIKEDDSSYAVLEGNFEFDLTADQENAIEDVSHDLSSNKPMDRLIVGDVGFGKTEVALRAAFKVIQNGQQVGLISPTTILAEQLYEIFKKRLESFGFKIELLSRFQGKEKNAQIVKEINKGFVDIAIGTHRLLQEDVKFSKLGLIIIDEEQRFGVRQKEKLKGLRIDTNVLSMSATPIPRSLHMALSGARDISVINTPPKGRKSIKTHIIERNWEKIKMIIQSEVNDHKQVYFLHNKVKTIGNIYNKLAELLPDVRFVFAHGQMNPKHLEKVISEFKNNSFDVLIASTIIENGIDIANVNTIIINNAHKFGLSQLYQLRGRVGRSISQSYCYLVYPENYLLEGAAKQRLYAIMNSQDLGSGFTVAMKDMEIRGAGNFLGSQQHGNISAIGFELYTRLLSNEVAKLKE